MRLAFVSGDAQDTIFFFNGYKNRYGHVPAVVAAMALSQHPVPNIQGMFLSSYQLTVNVKLPVCDLEFVC